METLTIDERNYYWDDAFSDKDENVDTIALVNLALCVIIVLVAIWAYMKKKTKLPLYIGGGFGLFGISHFATVIDAYSSLYDALLVLRVIGYLLVIFGLLTTVVDKIPARYR
jgi:uncharacterized membrane protein